MLYQEWICGKPLGTWNPEIPLNKRHRLLDDLAEFLVQLWTVPVPIPSDVAQERSCSYSVWLTQSLDRGLRRTLNGTAR